MAKIPSAPSKKALATKATAKFLKRNRSDKELAYNPEANVIPPRRPTPGKKPSDFCGIWRRTRPELFD